MKARVPPLLSALLSAFLALGAGAVDAGAAVHYQCEAVRGKCPKPPVPPPPPAPPAPPAIPGHAAPVAPEPPEPPEPPAPPVIDLPEIPAAFHTACATRNDGTRLTMTLRPGETMGGVCESEGGKMVFQLRSYHRED